MARGLLTGVLRNRSNLLRLGEPSPSCRPRKGRRTQASTHSRSALLISRSRRQKTATPAGNICRAGPHATSAGQKADDCLIRSEILIRWLFTVPLPVKLANAADGTRRELSSEGSTDPMS